MSKDKIFGMATRENIVKLWAALEKHKYKRRSLLFIDDQSSEAAINKGSKGEFTWLIYNAVWANLSILALTHKPTAISPAFRENLEHVIIFEQSNNRLRETVEKEFNPMETKKMFKDLLIEHTEKVAHGAIHISQKPPATIYPQFNVWNRIIDQQDDSGRSVPTKQVLRKELGLNSTRVSTNTGEKHL